MPHIPRYVPLILILCILRGLILFLRALYRCSCEAWNSYGEILRDCANAFATFRSAFSMSFAVQEISFVPFCRGNPFRRAHHVTASHHGGAFLTDLQHRNILQTFGALYFTHSPSRYTHGIFGHVSHIRNFSLCSD